MLREMDLEDWITSTRDEQTGSRPARRIYPLSTAGEDALVFWAQELEPSKRQMERFLEMYRRYKKGDFR